MNKHDQDYDAPEMRRGFFYKLLTVICGAVVGVFPMLAGLAVFFDPVKQKRGAAAAAAGDFLRVASLDSLPADGVPRQFPVVADQQDAWTFFPKQRVGSVFLRRTAADQPVQCFTSICPHAGCSVGYSAETKTFTCPCHNSQFNLDGEPIPPTPSPRGMDPLDVEVDQNGDVNVKYVNYYPGKHERKQK